jgi:Bacterial Ig domain
MKTGFLCSVVLLITGLLLSSAPQVRGDVTIYWDYDNGFYPSTVVIGRSNTVVWANVDPYGFDIILSIQGFDPYFLERSHSVGAMFPFAGTYNFSSDFNDHGKVVVNIPPLVAITNPTDTTVFASPASFTIEATASETPDDSVLSVEFFLESTDPANSIGIDYESPYSASVPNLNAGTYTLIALATDSWGWLQTNSISITVGGSTPISVNVPRISGGQFLFDVAGLTVGKTNVLQTSTNLTVWTPVKTNVADSASATITNSPAPGAHFYRVIQLP